MTEFKIIENLLERNRSIRRFDSSKKIDRNVLVQLVSLVRLCASGRNAQPLKYRIVDSEAEATALFPLLAWAGYYTDWAGPAVNEQPVAYLIQCLDTEIATNPMCDDGLQLEAITLGATALGIGGCIIKSFNPEKVASTLSIPASLVPLHVVALGYPNEKAKIVEMVNNNIHYYRDDYEQQCVPKRSVKELII